MKNIIAALLLVINAGAMAQTQNNHPGNDGIIIKTQPMAYTITKDPEEGGLIFNGPVTFDDLAAEPGFGWYKTGVAAYMPRQKQVDYLRANLKNYNLVIFMGTWCDDSHNLVPKLQKVLAEAGYPLQQITMYGVDRDKKTANGEQKAYDIKYVPAIILMHNGKEAGRITESVDKSIEDDLMAIIEKDRK